MSAAADEIWAILREVAQSQKETDRKFKELAAQAAADRQAAEARIEAQRQAAEAQIEAQRQAAETQRQAAEAQIEAQRQAAETQRQSAEAQIEAQRQAAETQRQAAETQRQAAEAQIEAQRQIDEAQRQAAETERRATSAKIRELGKQIGGLGEKFGSFTEGLALPSMEKILRQRFRMEVISPSVRVSKAGKHMEIDVLAYTNGTLNRAYVVEVKSHPREESIAQVKNLLTRFREFFPEHKDKALFGILAAVDLSAELKDKALREGLYVARIHDNVFELDTPDDFAPRAW
jgi:multidrug efflux pump subunit AcrA (membrane-fusion protein)